MLYVNISQIIDLQSKKLRGALKLLELGYKLFKTWTVSGKP